MNKYECYFAGEYQKTKQIISAKTSKEAARRFIWKDLATEKPVLAQITRGRLKNSYVDINTGKEIKTRLI